MESSKPLTDYEAELIGDPEKFTMAAVLATTGTEALDPEVLTPEQSELLRTQPATMTLVEWCKGNVSVNDESTAAAMEAMIARVLQSDNPDEVLTEEMTVPVEKITNRPVTLLGFRIGETDYADGFPYYALMDVVLAPGEKPRVVTCGAFKVMAQLAALDRLGEWPQVVEFRQAAKATRGGFYPISMHRPGALG